LCKLDKGKITNTTILIIAKLFFGAAHYHGCPVNYGCPCKFLKPLI
jgi:hypothetical protein